jgi:MFS superfamily sulfate permease-like transporter
MQDIRTGISRAGLAQLPLTTLNSVIAVTQLADSLFAHRHYTDAWRWRPSVIATAVGLMNVLGPWLGVFPCCHGSGGLAAQYKFGARWGAAPILLGVIKITLGLLFGSSLFVLLRAFPAPLLGALLLFSGIELSSVTHASMSGRDFTHMLLTTSAILALDNTGSGFVAGYICFLLVIAYELLMRKCTSMYANRS